MTATPIYSNGRSMKPPYQALVCMAPTSEMIALGRLCPVKVYNPDEIGRARRKGKKVKPVGDPIDHWKKYAADLPTVVFAATVADSKTICQRYNDAGITAEHIDANTPEEEREDIFLRSRRGITKIISNCNVLIEGLDLPWLACCQILRGCNSLILWIQASGRVMRAYPGKSHGILLDHAGAAHEFGLPDTDYQWSLDDERTNTLRNKPPKDRKPVTCQGCGAMFVGKQACPECGRVLPRQRRHSLLASVGGDGLLTEYNGDRPNFARQEILERLWKRCLFISRAKGGDLKRAAAIFTAQAKVPPWEANLSTPLPDRSQWNTSAREWLEVHG